MIILNLTQHAATAEQLAAGVTEPLSGFKAAIVAALSFSTLPTPADIQVRATALATIAVAMADELVSSGLMGDNHAYEAMIGGAPYLMGALERALIGQGIFPVYAFSQRESVEEVQPDGSVRKVNVFRHAGFVRAPVAK